jgi:hypothetical protein
MRTRLVFAEALDRCRSVRVSPERGDGFYSVGEISFVLGAPRGGTAGR